MILLDGKGHGEGWIFPFILLEQRLIKLIWNTLKEHNVTLTPVLSPPNLGLTEIQSDRVILIIFSLSDYSVCIQLYLHFFLFDTINMQFICLAIHTDKYIYSALWLQSSVCNINCNCPISVVVGREATLNWALGEQILMFVPIQCVTTDRSLHLHVLLPFLFALTCFEAGIASFLVSLWSPWRVFPLMLALDLVRGAWGHCADVSAVLNVHVANGRLSRSSQRFKPRWLHSAPTSLNLTDAM